MVIAVNSNGRSVFSFHSITTCPSRKQAKHSHTKQVSLYSTFTLYNLLGVCVLYYTWDVMDHYGNFTTDTH